MPQYIYPDDFEGTFWTVIDGAYYVSTVGNDITGDGSPKRPFLTVERAFDLALDGEKIIIGPDEYISYKPIDPLPSGALLPCRVATTGNVVVGNGGGGLAMIDGIQTEDGDRILVWQQDDPIENGVYISSSGIWERSDDFTSSIYIENGKLIPVLQGDDNGGKLFRNATTDKITIGETNIVIQEFALGPEWGGISGFLSNQTDLVDELNLKADKSNVLELDNATIFVPTADYHPSTKKFVEDQIAVLDKATPKGLLDASANPNYPAGGVGDYYYISVAGKVGGALGKEVQLGDKLQCIAYNDGGNQTAVGTSWIIFQGNLDKASSTDAQTGTDDEKYLTSAKGYEGWNSWVNSKVVNELNTTSKTIIGAINELESSGSTLVDGNGTSVNGGAVDLGGSLSTDVIIDGVSNNDFRVVNTSEFVVYPTTVVQLFGPDVYTGRTQLAFTDVFSGVVIENNLGFKIRDYRNEGSRKGFEYNADYSDDFVDRSLVDKAYVDTILSSAGGGISKVGTPAEEQLAVWTGDGTLGGTPYLLVGEDQLKTAYDITVGTDGGEGYGTIYLTRTNEGMAQIDIGTGWSFRTYEGEEENPNFGLFNVSKGGHALYADSDNRITVYGDIGMQYAGDYAASNIANDRWIPDKAYVDAQISSLGGGGISKVGTPASSSLAVWIGDGGTLGGASGLTFSGSQLYVSADIESVSSNSSFSTYNGSALEGNATRRIEGRSSESMRAGLVLSGVAQDDLSTSTPITQFTSSIDLADVTNMPLFGFYNNQTAVAKLLANGNWDFQSHLLKNLLDPVDPQDAATKEYVDSRSESSETYTPSVLSTLNAEEEIDNEVPYTIVGDIVTVAGRVDIETIEAGRTTVHISLPMPIGGEISGVGVASNALFANAPVPVQITDGTIDDTRTASIKFYAIDSGVHVVNIRFSYSK